MTDDFWSNPFHSFALAAGFLAASKGRLRDSRYVRELTYRLYEDHLAAKASACTAPFDTGDEVHSLDPCPNIPSPSASIATRLMPNWPASSATEARPIRSAAKKRNG